MTPRPWLALAALALVAACSGGTVAQPPPAPVNWQSFARPAFDAGANAPTAKESAIAQQYDDALASAGFALLGHVLDEDARFSFPGPGLDDVHGRDAVVQAHVALFGAFEQRHFVTSRLTRTAAEQTVEWTMSGVQARDWMGAAATQKPVVIKGATLLWTKDDGTLTDIHVYFDVAAVKAQLGAGPKELEGLPPPALPAGSRRSSTRRGKSPTTPRRYARRSTRSRTRATPRTSRSWPTTSRSTRSIAPGRRAARRAARLLPRDAQVDRPARHLDRQRLLRRHLRRRRVLDHGRADRADRLGPPAARPGGEAARVEIDEVQNAKIARVWRYDNPSEMATPGP